MRNRTNHALSAQSGNRLWFMQGSVRRDEPAFRTGKELLDWRTVAVWKSRQRSDLPFSARVADGDLAA